MIDSNYLKTKKTNLSRIQLEPLACRPDIEKLSSNSPDSRNIFFSSPQPSKLVFKSGGSSPKYTFGGQTPLDLRKSERFPERLVVEKRKTPPDIRKIENDWKKISANENRTVEVPLPQPVSCRRKNRIATQVVKSKNVGIPARFQALALSNSVSGNLELRSHQKFTLNDLNLLRSNSKDEIFARVEMSKIEGKYLNLQQRGSDHLALLENHWKWKTPNESNSEQSSFTECD